MRNKSQVKVPDSRGEDRVFFCGHCFSAICIANHCTLEIYKTNVSQTNQILVKFANMIKAVKSQANIFENLLIASVPSFRKRILTGGYTK